MDEVYATDFVGHGGGGEEIRGLEEFKGYMNEVFNAFPDVHFTIHDMFVEGDKGVTRLTWTGTHKGEMRGVPATNKKVTVWEISIVRFAGGKVVEEWARYDTLGMMQQLGLMPTLKTET